MKECAADIAKTANILSDELAQLGIPEPSFEQGLPAPMHSDAPDSNAGAARQKLLQMLDEFRALLTDRTLLSKPRAGKFSRANIFYMHLLSMSQPAQPIDQCAFHFPPGHRGKLPPRELSYGPGSSK